MHELLTKDHPSLKTAVSDTCMNSSPKITPLLKHIPMKNFFFYKLHCTWTFDEWEHISKTTLSLILFSLYSAMYMNSSSMTTPLLRQPLLHRLNLHISVVGREVQMHLLSKAKCQTPVDRGHHIGRWPLRARLCTRVEIYILSYILSRPYKNPSDENINHGPPWVFTYKKIT